MLSARLRDCRSASAGLEFAIIAPVLLVLMIGVFDIARAVIVQQQVYNAAHTIPVSASSLAVQTDQTTSLTPTQVQQSLSEIFAAMPWRRSGVLAGATSVTMSSVTFVQTDSSCVANSTTVCSYAPHTTWSVAYADPPGRNPANYNSFQNVTRPCMQLNQTLPGQGSPGDLSSLPTLGVISPDPILVVDVHYQYSPVFTKFMTGPVDFWASGLWAVRSVQPGTSVASQYTKYDTANANGGAGKCPGYS